MFRSNPEDRQFPFPASTGFHLKRRGVGECLIRYLAYAYPYQTTATAGSSDRHLNHENR